MSQPVFSHPDRSHTSFRPLKAWKHFRNLIADKEDTEQVFHIIEALRGKEFLRNAKRYWDTPAGQAALARNEYLPDLLDDHASLKKLPEGTVGRAYVDFMEREGLSAAGLVAEYEKFGAPKFDDMLERYGYRLRDTHDLFHVLTGYGRDALGEQCVLGFSYSQNPNLGILFISYAGGREIKKTLPKATPVYAAIREAQKVGKAAGRIAHQDIPSLLAEPLDAARKRLGIPEPVTYRRCHSVMRTAGIDPYDLLGNAKEEEEPAYALAA